MIKLATLLLSLLALSTGCATVRWVKPGSTQADYAEDKQYCELYAVAVVKRIYRPAKIHECMQERGWTEVKE